MALVFDANGPVTAIPTGPDDNPFPMLGKLTYSAPRDARIILDRDARHWMEVWALKSPNRLLPLSKEFVRDSFNGVPIFLFEEVAEVA